MSGKLQDKIKQQYKNLAMKIPLELDLDTLLSIAKKQEGKLIFELIKQNENGDIEIRIWLREGTPLFALIKEKEFRHYDEAIA